MTSTDALPPDAAAFVRGRLGESWVARPLAGDASVRAYYRVATPDGQTYILAWYPPEVADQLTRFLAAYRAVSPHARVPELIAQDHSSALQQDAGDRTLFAVLHEDRVAGLRLYRAAVDLLVDFQRAPGRDINPPFTAGFFANELEMTREFYVGKLMGAREEDADALKPLFKTLAENVASQPFVLTHRDYHGQNIHVVNDHLFLIDYQDMRMGPATYDLASLLRDRGVGRVLGDETEMELVEYYGRRAAEYAHAGGAGPELRRHYFETLLQRSIKILGTFSRQPIQRGKLHYLDFIPPTLESVRRCLDELPQFAPLASLLPMDFDLERSRQTLERIHSHGQAQDHAPAR
ncbi:MAG TPA: phosphotransferase [Thermoanaerobaculia bacterium]|jgi:aminoglycoside/choline kinase family phosphotransferase|nr:phosphotransferase [Thermoanaerobaculia bacterium]